MNRIFNPKHYIKPCYRDGNGYRSHNWLLLDLLLELIKNDEENPEIIKKILSAALDVYCEDENKESDKHKKLSSSWIILDNLIEILLSKEIYVNDDNVIKYYEIFKNSSSNRAEYFLYKIDDNFNSVKNLKPDTILKIYIDILSNMDNRFITVDKFFNDNLKYVISKNPLPFLKHAIGYIASINYNDILNFGSLIKFSSNVNARKDLVIMIEWIKYSAKLIEHNIVNDFIYDNIKGNRMGRKAAILLMTIKSDTETLFKYDNLFERDYLYHDLREYLAATTFSEEQKETIKDMISSVHFKRPELSDALFSALDKVDMKQNMNHYQKIRYDNIVNTYGVGNLIIIPQKSNEEYLREILRDSDFEEIKRIKEEVSNNIFVFETEWLNVYSEKLLEDGGKMLLDNIKSIKEDKSIMLELLHGQKDLPDTYMEAAFNVDYLYEENYLKTYLNRLSTSNHSKIQVIYNGLDFNKIISMSNSSDSDSLNSVLYLYCKLGLILRDKTLIIKLKKAPSKLAIEVVALIMDGFIDNYDISAVLDFIYPIKADEIPGFYDNLLVGLKSIDDYVPFVKKKEFEKCIENEDINDTTKYMYFNIAISLYYNDKINGEAVNKLMNLDIIMFLNVLLNTIDDTNVIEQNKVEIEEMLNYSLEIIKNNKSDYGNLLDDILRSIIYTNNEFGTLWKLAMEVTKDYKGYYCTYLYDLFEKYSVTNHNELSSILFNMIDSDSYSTDYRPEAIRKILDIINNCPVYKDIKNELNRKIQIKYESRI